MSTTTSTLFAVRCPLYADAELRRFRTLEAAQRHADEVDALGACPGPHEVVEVSK